ncbi:MAG: hypothetical protein ACI36W_04255 [Coriobacteriales bacterium]
MLLVIGACALFALCVLLFLEVAGVTGPVLEVKTYQPRGAGPSSSVALMIMIAALIGLWGPFSCLRCYDPSIRRCLIGVFVLLEVWLLLVVCKYCVSSDALSVALWYLYYVPMLLIPMLCLFAALHAAECDASTVARAVKRAVVAATALLIASVLTNSLHQLVFVFDTANPEWSSSYTYGTLYYVIFGMIALEMLAFLGVLFLNSCKQLHSALIPLLALGAIILAFCIAYALRLPAAFARNFSLSSIIFVMATLELCFDSGLLPSFLHYREMFRSLPFDLKIFPLRPARRNQPILATEAALALTKEAQECLDSYEGTAPVSVCYDKDPDKIYRLQRIAGGILLLTEDVSGLNAHRNQLLEKQEALTRTCALLEQERLVALQLQQQRKEAALFDEVERSITESLSKASSLITEAAQLQPEDPELSRRKLMLAKMLVSYSKRKGELAISCKRDSRYDHEKLQLIVGELIADLQACGIACASLVETTSMLPSDTVSVLYDCLYDFAIVTLYHPSSALMVCLRSLSGSRLELRLSLETEPGDDLLGSEEAGELRALLDAHNVAYSFSGEDGVLRLRMSAQGGGA